MSQKYIKTQNKNSFNSKSYGKYYAQPVYDQKFIETDEIADFIQTQATLKRSDIKAALDELGAAMKHFLEMGQKIRLAGIGIFKVGDCTSATITSRRVLFQPETERIVVGSAEKDGKIIQKYVNAKSLIKDVVFEETHDNSMNLEPEDAENSGSGNGNGGSNTGGNQGGNTGGNTGGGGDNGDDD